MGKAIIFGVFLRTEIVIYINTKETNTNYFNKNY